MLQISKFRLFLTANHSSLLRFCFKPSFSYLFLSRSKPPHKPLSVSLVTLSSSRIGAKVHPSNSRSNSTLRDSKKKKEEAELMEEVTHTGSIGFNKRRVEGKYKDDKPKNLQLKVRKLNPVSTISYVQILGTGMDTQDTSPSVLLFFDKQRFIFNAGEGLQRYCTEHKINLSKIDHIFLSRVCSETTGGLPGLLLNLATIGDEGMSVNVWGSSDLKYLVGAMRSFIPRAALVHTHRFGLTPNADGPNLSALGEVSDPIVLIHDEVVKISAIIIRPSYSISSDDPNVPCTSSTSLYEEKTQLSSPLPNSRNPERSEGSVVKPSDISVIYVCELPEIKGKFDKAKAVALGLKPGPKYRKLQLGISVKSDKKNIMVHPSDVLGPSVPGPIVLLVDCPTHFHFQEMSSIKSLSCYYTDSVDHKSANCIIHLSPSSVTMTSTYQNWMKKFGAVQHIMAGHEIKNIEIPILKSSARIAARLNYLCPQFFPAPGFWSLQDLRNCAPTSDEGYVQNFHDIIYAENLLKFNLRPYAHLGLDRSRIPRTWSSSAVVKELLSDIPEITDSMKQVCQLWNESAETKRTTPYTQESTVMTEVPWMDGDYACIPDIKMDVKSKSAYGDYACIPDIKMDVKSKSAYGEEIACLSINEARHDGFTLPSCLENITREDMEIVLLGTGSSQPSIYRNVSSIYVNLFSKGSLLLDCGEGSLGQLKRRFGLKGADDAIRSLRCIWISHMHADHHMGLSRILSWRRELLKGVSHEPILVIGPGQLERFLEAYQRFEDLDMHFLDCRHTTEASLASFESYPARDGSHSPPGSPVVPENTIGGIGVTQNIETDLFAKGSRMQSYWKRPSSPTGTSKGFLILRNLNKILEEVGLESLISVPVVHCRQAYGIVVKASERTNTIGKTIPGWKLVYSGDTRPCPELRKASRGATVLIHEATYEDNMIAEAVVNNHSTTKEAIEVGDSAGAYRIILTHFCKRYPMIPVFHETHKHKTCIAFDLMSVNVADLPVLPKLVPHLKLLFRHEMMVDEIDDFVEPLL